MGDGPPRDAATRVTRLTSSRKSRSGKHSEEPGSVRAALVGIVGRSELIGARNQTELGPRRNMVMRYTKPANESLINRRFALGSSPCLPDARTQNGSQEIGATTTAASVLDHKHKNAQALVAFRHHVTDLWRRTLRRRSQKDGITWARMTKLADDWLPKPTILHPWPSDRFAVTHPRWEPYAGKPHVRFCAGGAQ